MADISDFKFFTNGTEKNYKMVKQFFSRLLNWMFTTFLQNWLYLY